MGRASSERQSTLGAMREPVLLPAASESPFVGRVDELNLLENTLRRTVAGSGGVVFVEGEAGIGKTRLAEQVAGAAKSSGVDVFWGRCWEGGGAPAFWPWIQIIRSLAQGREVEDLRSVMGPGAADIAQVVPELRDQMPDLRPLPEPLEPEQGRFRLFDSVAALLRRWTKERPTLLVFDDIHWADKPTLRLLEFVLQDIGDSRLLIVATYRDDEVSKRAGLSDAIPEFLRARASTHLKLRGLTRCDVAEILAATVGATPSDDTIASLYSETDGNPLFVSELVRARIISGVSGDGDERSHGRRVPETLREVIVRRCRNLSSDSVRFVQVSSVIGRQFDLRIVQCVIGRERDACESVEEACAIGIIEGVPRSATLYRFTHALVREAIYEQLPDRLRRTLHSATGRAIEDVYRSEGDDEIAALAFHFFRALPDGDADKAVRYCVRAAERATRLLAHEEAVDHYRLSLIAEGIGKGDAPRRCQILLALGQALTRAGDVLHAKETFAQAAYLARQLEAGEQLAEAALGICGLFPANETAEPSLRRLLEEVLGVLEGSVDSLHAKVLAAASNALHVSWSGRKRVEICQRALLIARRSGDVHAEMQALDASHYAFLSPRGLAERFAIARELVKLADGVGDKEMSLRAHYHLVTNYLDDNNVAAADVELSICDGLATQLRQPSYQWQVVLVRGMRALLAGRFDEADELSNQARIMREKWGDPRVLLTFWSQEVWLRRDLGKLQEIEISARRLASAGVGTYTWEAVVVLLLAEIGRRDEARSLLLLWKEREFQEDAFLLTVLSLLAAASGVIEDDVIATVLYQNLRVYEGRGVAPGLGAPVFLGTTDLYLGILAGLRRDLLVAKQHLLNALEIHERAGARPLMARTHFELGKVLGQLGRRDEARSHLSAAIAEFDALGMAVCLQRGREALARLEECSGGSSATSPAISDSSVADTEEEAVFRSDGEYWTVTFAGKTARFKDVRGFRYIAYLLARAHEPVPALDLAVLGMQPADTGIAAAVAEQEGLHVADFGSRSPILDERARAAYRARLRELSAERDEAERLNDYGRLERIDGEIEVLMAHLTAGSSAGTRSRRWGSSAERARVNVRNSIAKALRTIERHHEALYRHLRNSLKTGAVCAYAPEHRVSWQVTAA